MLASLTNEDKVNLAKHLPASANCEQTLRALLNDTLPTQFGSTPLQSFGTKVGSNIFTEQFQHLKNLEEIEALYAERDRIEKQLAAFEASEAQSDDFEGRALNLLFMTERSRVFAEDAADLKSAEVSCERCNGDLAESIEQMSG